MPKISLFKVASRNKAYRSALVKANRAKKAAGVAWRKAVQGARAKSRRRK